MEPQIQIVDLAARAARRGLSQAGRLAGTALDLILPPRALDDAPRSRVLVQSHGLSLDAWGRIPFIEAPFCETCGSPFEQEPGPGGVCASCARRPPAFDRARAACLYDEGARDLVLKLKHADRTDLAGLFATWLSRAAADLLPEADAILPVPLHPTRLFSRRYNQTAEIARPLARMAKRPYFPDALRRVRATASQGGKSADGRRRNVAGVFEVSRGWRRRIAGKRLLLIDDVLTTGATLEGCARALKAAGALSVDVAVVARVKIRLTRPI